jgi:hypothetical protein
VQANQVDVQLWSNCNDGVVFRYQGTLDEPIDDKYWKFRADNEKWTITSHKKDRDYQGQFDGTLKIITK